MEHICPATDLLDNALGIVATFEGILQELLPVMIGRARPDQPIQGKGRCPSPLEFLGGQKLSSKIAQGC